MEDSVSITRPQTFTTLTQRLCAQSNVRSRRLEAASGRTIHVLEKGAGEPLLLLHGGGTCALQMLPLMVQLDGIRAIAVDRPGFGFSDPVPYDVAGFRAAAVEHVTATLDALGIEQAHLAGNSMGGAWAVWAAIDRPDRVRSIAVLGAIPMAEGARIPFPLRLMAMPGLGGLLMRAMKPSPQAVIQMMGEFGEAQTISELPDQLDAMVAAGHDPVASAAGLAELRAIMTPLGMRARARLRPDDLAGVRVPTTVLMGESDPVGPGDYASNLAASFAACASTHTVAGGHLPWLRSPKPVSSALLAHVQEVAARDGNFASAAS